MLQPGWELGSNQRLLAAGGAEVALPVSGGVDHEKILDRLVSSDEFGLHQLQLQSLGRIGLEAKVVEPGREHLQQLCFELCLVAEAFHLVCQDQHSGKNAENFELTPMAYHLGQGWHGLCQTDAYAGVGLEGSWSWHLPAAKLAVAGETGVTGGDLVDDLAQLQRNQNHKVLGMLLGASAHQEVGNLVGVDQVGSKYDMNPLYPSLAYQPERQEYHGGHGMKLQA
jgi:hypothetical protein